jgi:hypothetical protein
MPSAQLQQRNPLGPSAPPGDSIYGDLGDPTGAEYDPDEEEALDEEDEGAGSGVPPAFATSSRRLGMSPEGSRGTSV